MHLQSLEVGDYLKAFETIHAARFGFEDVQRFMFKPQINVILNLLAVHYCMAILGIRVFHPLLFLSVLLLNKWYYAFQNLITSS